MQPDSEADTVEKELSSLATVVDRDPLAGTLLDGRYLLKRKLGHGGFGSVYLASDEKIMSRPVVVKMLHVEKTSHEWSLKKFKQEIEAMSRIDHPSIVGVIDSGQSADGMPYIVMQYVSGVSLRSQISPEGIPFARAANIIRQMGRALSAAHERGVLHRDLKPENIMLQDLDDGEEQVKIIDFGVARVKDSVVSMTTTAGITAGTAAYMSPEQLCAGSLTTASDVYSFAIIAYEILTGRRPMNPDSVYQLLEMQRSGVRVKPTDLRPNLPAAAEPVILQALSFDPRERPARAREFGDLLSATLVDQSDSEQTQTRPAGASDSINASSQVAESAVRQKRPFQNAYLIVATGLVIVALASLGLWYGSKSARPNSKTTATAETAAPVGPQQSLTYWLTVQKMLNNKPLGAPIESEGNIIFGNGWKFRLNLRPSQNGALYLINVGPGTNGGDEYNVLFPLPASKAPLTANEKLDPRLAANQMVQLPTTDWYRFVEATGVEKVWLIWSAEPLPDLDSILVNAARDKDHPGVISNADHIAQIQSYFKQYEASRPDVSHDKATNRTSMKAFGKVVVNLIELSHAAV